MKDFGNGVYALSDNGWQSAFLVTEAGVIVFDAPASYGKHIPEAVAKVTNKPIKMLVYSHINKDHIGGSVAFRNTPALQIIALDTVSDFLSHGNQKQLELGIALAGNPEILLLDEPTAGMSAAETRDSMELLRRIAAERGLTLLFTEHDMNVVFSTAQRIAVLLEDPFGGLGLRLLAGLPVELVRLPVGTGGEHTRSDGPDQGQRRGAEADGGDPWLCHFGVERGAGRRRRDQPHRAAPGARAPIRSGAVRQAYSGKRRRPLAGAPSGKTNGDGRNISRAPPGLPPPFA